MTELARRRSAALVVTAGVSIAIISIVAEDIGLGSGNGTFGAWQQTGLAVGLVMVVVSIAWLLWPQVSRVWSLWRSDLIGRAAATALVVAAAVLLGLFSIVAESWPRYNTFPKLGVLVGFVAIIGVGRKSTTVLGAAGVGVVLVSIFADDLGLGSRSGRWQRTGLVIGVVAVLGSGLWQIAKRDQSNEPVDGQNDLSSSQDLSLWGRRGIWLGGVAVALSLYLGDPFLGGGVLGWWRIALVALGLLAIGAGLVAVLWHSVWRTAVKATFVVVTVAALSVSVVAWDQVPPAAPSCSEVEMPTVEDRVFYCYEADGTLVRNSTYIHCDGIASSDLRREFRGLLPAWWTELPAVGCKL